MIICKFSRPEDINAFISKITPDKYIAIWCRDVIADGRTDFAKIIVTDEFKNPLPGTYTCLFSGNAVDAPNVSVDTINNYMITNNELKRRIFDTYSNCLVQHPCDNSGFEYRGVSCGVDVFTVRELNPVLFGDWSGGTNPEYAAQSHCDWGDCKLLLKRMECISKEDAIAVAEIISPDKNIGDCIDDGWQKSFLSKIGNNSAKLYPMRCLAMWDMLRFKGYDCGYFDAVTSTYIPSLIDAGYAVEKK